MGLKYHIFKYRAPSYGMEVRGGTVDMSHLVLSNNYDETYV